MICCMETWFVADRGSLRIFFQDCWRDSALPKWPDLAVVDESRVFEALALPTAVCGKKRYSKSKVSFALLKSVNPVIVEQ